MVVRKAAGCADTGIAGDGLLLRGHEWSHRPHRRGHIPGRSASASCRFNASMDCGATPRSPAPKPGGRVWPRNASNLPACASISATEEPTSRFGSGCSSQRPPALSTRPVRAAGVSARLGLLVRLGLLGFFDHVDATNLPFCLLQPGTKVLGLAAQIALRIKIVGVAFVGHIGCRGGRCPPVPSSSAPDDWNAGSVSVGAGVGVWA